MRRITGLLDAHVPLLHPVIDRETNQRNPKPGENECREDAESGFDSNERSTAMSLNTFAANAAIVVSEVNIIARPTLWRVVSAASSGVAELPRSSL